MNNCFAHSGEPAVARVYVGEPGARVQVNWLYVCAQSAALYRRWGHRVEDV